MTPLQENINACLTLISAMRKMNINYNTRMFPQIGFLINHIQAIIPIINEKYPTIVQILINAIGSLNQNGFVNAYSLGDIRTAIKILNSLENPIQKAKSKKLFISHSSIDKKIVETFVDTVLLLGIGIKREDIFCTSIEDMAIKNGDDIRQHIQEKIRTADFSFLLISDNYKQSEICLNEMGAVWAYDANVRLYLLPDVSFQSIGWLCDTRKADKISDAIALDTLFDEITSYYNLKKNIIQWGKQRENFLQNINKISG